MLDYDPMKPALYMVIAGEASGDILAAELVKALRGEYATASSGLEPQFIGAGGPHMAAAGVNLEIDMTAHAVIGFVEALKKLLAFRRIFHQLLDLAIRQTPDALLCVDFSGFNRRFAHAVKQRAGKGALLNWNPKLVQFVSPQVWASRPGRARLMARDFDLLLSIFPFEPEWYARNAPGLRVEYVGHPIVDRYKKLPPPPPRNPNAPHVVLLPGSRTGELKQHLPPIFGAADYIHRQKPQTRFTMVLPEQKLIDQARAASTPSFVHLQRGNLPETLSNADLTIACTGTVTLECAWFRVPTVALYKTSFSTYHIAKRIITVKYLAMPNLLANEPVFPEFIQHDATPEKIGQASLELLNDPRRLEAVRTKLATLSATLGKPGALNRAAHAVLSLQAQNP